MADTKKKDIDTAEEDLAAARASLGELYFVIDELEDRVKNDFTKGSIRAAAVLDLVNQVRYHTIREFEHLELK